MIDRRSLRVGRNHLVSAGLSAAPPGEVSRMTTKAKEIVVTTEWVAKHASDPKVRIVEVDVDTAAYDQGHVEHAVGWNWQNQLCDTVKRDIIPKADLEKLLSAAGIANDTTVVLY